MSSTTHRNTASAPQSESPSARRKTGKQRPVKARHRFWSVWSGGFVLILAGSSLMIVPSLLRHERSRMDIIDAHAQTHLVSAQHIIHSMFHERSSDALILARSDAIRNALTMQSDAADTRIIETFKALASTYKCYDQIRLLDHTGQELYRVNCNGSQCTVTPRPELQNKANRYYFKEAIQCSLGEVYISPLDLNVEHGKIEEPHKPMIRFATPVADRSNTIRGAVVLNYRAKPLLDTLFPQSSLSNAALRAQDNYLINSEGYYLKSTQNPDKEFAFMFHRKADRFSIDYPEVWKAALEGNNRLLTSDGLFLIRTLSIPASRHNGDKTSPDPLVARPEWFVVHKIPTHSLHAASILHSPARQSIWIGLYLLAVAAFSLLLALRRAQINSVLQTTQILNNTLDALDSADIGLLWVEFTSGTIIKANRGMCSLLGGTKTELLGKHICDIDQALSPETYPDIREAILNHGKHTIQMHHHPREGHDVLIDLTLIHRKPSASLPRHFVGMGRDVTERREAEEKLRTSEDNLKRAQQTAHLGSWVLEHATKKLHWSDEAYRIFEVNSKNYEADFELFLSSIHPADLERVRQSFYRSVQEHTPYFVEHRLLLPDGRIKFVEERGETLFDHNGNPVSSSGTVLDITERITGEQARRAAENKFQRYMELASDGIFIMDPHSGELLECSELAAAQLGYSVDELKHLSVLDWDKDFQSIEEYRKIVKRIGFKSISLERTHTRKDGSTYHAAISAVRINLDDYDSIYASVRDITQEKKQLLQMYQAIETITNSYHYRYRPESDELSCSDNMFRVYGIPYTDHPDKELFLERMTPESLAKVMNMVRQQLDGPIAITITTPDGQCKHLETIGVLRTMEDGTSEYLVTGTDVTEKRLAEEKEKEKETLRSAKEAAEAASQAKSEFLAAMSHEIRTPLNAIINSAYLLGHTQLNDEQKDDIRAIEISGKSLLLLINDTLDLAKVEAGHLTIDPHLFSLEELLQDLKILFGPTCRDKAIDLQILLPGTGLPPLLIGDSNRLRQILVNLLGNAVKFTSEGRISLTVDCAEQLPLGNSIHLGFSVTDTGIGIDPAVQNRLFQPFTQADMSTSRTYGGTGLGLALVKQLTELMIGNVSLKSAPGIGSTFRIEIPFLIGKEDPVTDALQPDNARPLAGLRILVVDDGMVNLKILTRVLELEAAKPVACSTAEDAIQQLKDQSEPFDLVLMDVQMPGMNGLDATICIRQELKLTLPVIALTGGVTDFERDRALAAGMNAFLAKPIEPKKLVQTVYQQIARPHPETTAS